MISPSLHFRRLLINGFRGIRAAEDPVEIDLSARLTVLLAANGTGKTSICEAAEWLLTGEVEGRTTEELAWRGDSKPIRFPFAKAEVSIAGASWELMHDGEWRFRKAGSNARRSTDQERMALIAPDAVAGDPGRWLKGARFLNGADLGLLLDNEPGTLERRKAIFADLLGIQHLKEAETRLDQYMDVIGRTVRDTRNERDEIDRRIAELPVEGGASATDAVMEGARRALVLLGREAATEEGAEEALERLRMVVREEEGRNRTRIDALAGLDRLERPLEELSTELAALEGEQAVRKRRIACRERAIARNRRIHDVYRDRRDVAMRRLAELHETRSRAIALWQEVADANVETLRRRFPSITSPESRRKERDTIERQRHHVGRWRDAAERLRKLEGELNHGIGRSDDEMRRKAGEDRKALEDELASLKSQMTAAGAAATTLRAAARSWLDTFHFPVSGSSEGDTGCGCPLCGHDWRTEAELRDAIARTLENVPEASAYLARRHAVVANALTDARSHERDVAARMDLIEWETKLTAEREAHHTAIKELGMSGAPDEWEGELFARENRLRAADILAELVSILSDVEDHEPRPEIEARTLAERCEAARDELSARVARSSAMLDKAERQRAAFESSLHAHQTDEDDVHQRIKALREMVHPALAHWAFLSSSPFTRGRLAQARDDVRRDHARVAEARGILEAAEGAQRVEWVAEERERLQAQREKLDTALEGMKRLSQPAEKARDAIVAHRIDFVRRQMAIMRPRIESLFARVHANQVIGGLSFDGQDPLAWSGILGEQRLQPREFSQGQRQDLALAIFLARACMLKGTFFLDEPLVHLDDLNRTGLLDCLRVIALTQPDVHLVLTTASLPLARHIQEKFGLLDEGMAKVLRLQGSPNGGFSVTPMG